MGNGDRTTGLTKLELPEMAQQVRPLRPPERATNFVLNHIPVVDKLRQLYTRFGMRTYRVFLVHLQWAGNKVGQGGAHEISRLEILPTPLIVSMTSTSEVLRSAGLTEEGSIIIREVSGKYSEDDLLGRTPDLQDPTLPRTEGRTKEFFWEVVEARAGSPLTVHRRYRPNGVPTYKPSMFQWEIPLVRQEGDRARDGRVLPRSAY